VQDVEPTEVGGIIAQQCAKQNKSDDDAFASFKL